MKFGDPADFKGGAKLRIEFNHCCKPSAVGVLFPVRSPLFGVQHGQEKRND